MKLYAMLMARADDIVRVEEICAHMFGTPLLLVCQEDIDQINRMIRKINGKIDGKIKRTSGLGPGQKAMYRVDRPIPMKAIEDNHA
jgi:hypothetical protein